jgi:hypothetical protein
MNLIEHLTETLGKETIKGKVYSIYYSPLTNKFVFFNENIPAFQMTADEIISAAEFDSDFFLLSYLAFDYDYNKSRAWDQHCKSVSPILFKLKESIT